jgi:hypothetical protein
MSGWEILISAPELDALRVRNPRLFGGERGTRTLDLGIMSATL